MMKRALAAAAILALAAAAPAPAQTYPDRTVTIVVPFPAGGPTDELARLAAHGFETRLKGNFIVSNISGGGANIGSNHVAHSPADGYTLLLHNLAIAANVTLYKDLPFDTEKDLRPVMFINRNPLVLVGRRSLPPNNLSELVAWMKANRAKFAIPGYGTTGHLATVLFGQEAKLKFDIIPYRGGTPVVTDLLGDHVDLFFGTPQQVGPQVLAGKLKAFGITSTEKLPQLPNVDSFPKMFGPKFEIQYWQALFAPSGTPDAIVDKLNSTLEQVVDDPAILKIWAGEGVTAFPKNQRSPDAGRALMKSEIARWGEVIRANNIHIEQ
ncbi:MAG TPA: tripartite tricarboxylate transporter substrate binding protein [Xanthobacteraceae bacterium]|nr:tripartite tricarboxylate transporter substrate binding protein [Xanthobacteraceae bacterium]